jgi:hypothetical protein
MKKGFMSENDRNWLSSHTKFNLGLTVEEIEAMQSRIQKLQKERDTLQDTLRTARHWLLGIYDDIHSDDYGVLQCVFEGGRGFVP